MEFRRRKISKTLERMLVYSGIAIILMVFIFPVLWMYMTAFKRPTDAIADPPIWIFEPSLFNWEDIIYKRNALLFLTNSTIVVSCTTALTILFGSLAGYALARFKFRGRDSLAFDILTFRMFPPIATLIPIFILMKELRLVNTHIGLIIACVSFNLPLSIWLMRGFFLDFPYEIEEAAMIDGCSRLHALLRIILPLSTPGLVAATILCFIFSWNEFMFASALTTLTTQTLPVGVAGVEMRYYMMWGSIAAFGVLITVPVLVVALIGQKYLIRGLTYGAIKG